MSVGLVVDRHPLFREAMVQLLRVAIDFPQVVSAGSVDSALRLAVRRRAVRLVLTDLPPPELNGQEGIGSLRHTFGSATLMVVSSSEERRDVAAAFRAGANAFISKAVGPQMLVAVIRRGLAGREFERRWITPEGERPVENKEVPQLSPRQKEVLMLLSRGYSNKEIALHLGLAEITVKQHVSSLFRVLDVGNRTQAVLSARGAGLGASG